METETYNLDVFCKNCDFEGNILIPKGLTLSEIPCSNCGTKMLIKKMKPIRIIPHIEDYR